MSLHLLLLVAGTAFAGVPARPVQSSPEVKLAVLLSSLRQNHASAMRRAVMGGGAEDLRDAVATGSGETRKRLAGRLPGMAPEPFNICRTLAACPTAPLSLHAEDSLTDSAFQALARPWIKLQEARGKKVVVKLDPGAGVVLELEDMPAWPVVILAAEPAPTGGFDIAVENGPEAAKAYAAAREAVLPAQK